MKASADPLVVEYSFREYQNWLAETSAQFGGRVHSTAGDGAVINFNRCEDALAAASAIQDGLAEFNRDHNRLTLPFRLRIGLHSGQVIGELDQVQFAEVIDIAAHIQGASPVGAVGVSDDVATNLSAVEFVHLQKEIDGHQIYLFLLNDSKGPA